MIASRPFVPSAREHLLHGPQRPLRSDLGSTRKKPAVPPSAPQQRLDVFANPNPERDYVIQFVVPEFTCNCPLTGQPDFAHFTIEMVCRPAVRRAEEPEALLLELPRRRRVPREGDEHDPRRHRRRDQAALRPHRRALERARRHLHQRRRRAPQEGLERRRPRSRCRRRRIPAHALVMWAKVPGTARPRRLRADPLPTMRSVAAPRRSGRTRLAFDLSHPLP